MSTSDRTHEPSTSNEGQEKAYDDARDACTKLLMSPRGDYIISQALYIAAQELEKVDMPHRELSNIADMRLLTLQFPTYVVAEAAKHGTGTTELFEAWWKLPVDKKD